MAIAFGKKYKLNKYERISWLDGSNTKTKKYLWLQLKYSAYADNPISISIFVEKGIDENIHYRISLEIKNDAVDKSAMDKYHTHLDLPLNTDAGLVYVSGSHEWGVQWL